MKQLIGHDIGTYAFNKTAGTITFSDVTLALEQILLVVDATAGVIIYQLGSTTLGGSMSDNVLTLTYSTSALSNGDSLQIYADVPVEVSASQIAAAIVSNPPTVAVSGSVSVSSTIPVNLQDGNGNIITSTSSALNVSLPSATVTTLTPPSASAIGTAVAAPSASAIASAIVSNPPTVGVSSTVTVQPASTVMKTIKALSVTSGTPQAVWTPSSGKKFVLLGYSLGTGGTLASILFEDTSGSTYEFARTPSVTVGANSPSGFSHTSSAANNVLYLDVTTSCTLNGFVFGYEE